MRMGNGCLDQDNAQKYFDRALQFKNKLIDLCDNNADVLRYDKARLSLRGVLSVDNVGRLTITHKSNKNANMGKIQHNKDIKHAEHTEQYKWMVRDLKEDKVEYRAVAPLNKKLTEKEIIDKISGGDLTDGSCASVAYAYVGNKAGLDVTDFRGGDSRKFFAYKYNGVNIANLKGVESREIRVWNEAKEVMSVLNELDAGKEYVLRTGKHAAIVRKTDKGTLQYLELQSGKKDGNGFKDFDNSTLKVRFGCTTRKDKYPRTATLAEVDSLGKNEEFRELLGYINTATDKQKKGASGYAK